MWCTSSSDDASWQFLSLSGLTTSYFRRHKRVTATVQEMLHTETNATAAGSTLTEAHPDSSTRRPCPLPPEIQRRPPRYDASTALRALEFALPGQW
jgi:acyl-CoA thioesterase FadM